MVLVRVFSFVICLLCFIFSLLSVSCNHKLANENKFSVFFKENIIKSKQLDSLGIIRFAPGGKVDFYFVSSGSGPSKTDFKICFLDAAFFLNYESSNFKEVVSTIKSELKRKTNTKGYVTVELTYNGEESFNELESLFIEFNSFYLESSCSNKLVFCLYEVNYNDCKLFPPLPPR